MKLPQPVGGVSDLTTESGVKLVATKLLDTVEEQGPTFDNSKGVTATAAVPFVGWGGLLYIFIPTSIQKNILYILVEIFLF